jgi:nucleotide-binding universal stress UspA family protein
MALIDRILCPIDFSETSRHALEHAFAFARWYQARVTVLHVLNVPLPPMMPAPGLAVPAPGVPEDLSALPPLRRDDVVEEAQRFSGSITGADQNCVDVVVVEGSAVREILSQAEQIPADLLVMGTHGRSGFEALFLGSVTEKVLRSTEVPVLTVPPAVERVESVAYQTILCPIEFSDASTRALEYALTLAEETGARLILLHVIELLVDAPQRREISHFTVPEYQRYLEEDARARLRSAVPEDARVWCTPEERVISGNAFRVILDLAEQEKAEVIVMGVHGKGALNRRLFGSTTHHVIREAGCPVLTLRA